MSLTTEMIDQRSRELIAEFRSHRARLRAQFKVEGKLEQEEQSKTFEGWAIQKIASLQLLVEHLCGIDH